MDRIDVPDRRRPTIHGFATTVRSSSIDRSDGDAPAQIALDWGFNSWGEKYGAYDLDDVVPRRLGERFGFEVVEPGIVLEGGSIDVNGDGLLLTTESCLLNPNRNPALSRAEIEEYLRVFLGVTQRAVARRRHRGRRHRRARR